MRRTWIIAGLIVSAAAGAAAYKRASNWKEFHFIGTGLMADLAHPDAVIRTRSLSQLPHDLLKVPIARDVLTEDLAFYYEQHEDRMGLNGAIKRIAYEHDLGWSDRLLASVLDAPAEVAFWRDGKGALRHYALVLKRNALAKVLQEAATVAIKDAQLTSSGVIETAQGQAQVLALEVNPRRTLLLISLGDRLVVLSDPGLLHGEKGFEPAAQQAVRTWLEKDGSLTRDFALNDEQASASHTLAIGASTLAMGYGEFISGFKGLRFDYDNGWSTAVRVDAKHKTGLGDEALWRATPANPSACALLPIDWSLVRRVVNEAEDKPSLPDNAMATLEGAGVACWYNESNLYSPVFVARLTKGLPKRDAALQLLAVWAIDAKNATKHAGDATIWRNGKAALGASGDYVVFSPDSRLVEKALDTLARTHPSVADQMPASGTTLALLTPRPLSAMADREIRRVAGETDLQAVNTHLPSKMKALASYPPYRLELAAQSKARGEWLPVEWRALDAAK